MFFSLSLVCQGCILPCHGGVFLPSQNFSLCLNQSHYDNNLLIPQMLTIMEKMKMPCKLSEILYGPMHILDGQNSTRFNSCLYFQEMLPSCILYLVSGNAPILNLYHCNFFLRLQLLLPPSLYRTEESMKMTTTSLQVFSFLSQRAIRRSLSFKRLFTEQHRGIPGSLPWGVSFAGPPHP